MKQLLTLLTIIIFLSCEESGTDLNPTKNIITDTVRYVDTVIINDTVIIVETKQIFDTVKIYDTVILNLTPKIPNLNNLYQTWHTKLGSFDQYGFTLYESGRIEFLQWDLSEGKLVSPFTSYDYMVIDQLSGSYYFDMNNCEAGFFSDYKFDNDGNFAGNIIHSSEDSLILDAYFVNYENSYAGGITFYPIDQETFTRSPIKNQYEADVQIRYKQSSAHDILYTFKNPEVGVANYQSAEHINDSLILIRMVAYDTPCVNGIAYRSYINLAITSFDGPGTYQLNTDFRTENSSEYSVIDSDAIWGYPLDSAYIQVDEFDKAGRFIAGRFGLYREDDELNLRIRGNLKMYLTEDNEW